MYTVTMTEMTPTPKSNSDIVCHTVTFPDMLAVLKFLEQAEINFTVFISVVIVNRLTLKG